MGESWNSFDPAWAIKQANEIYEYMPFRQVELAPEVCVMEPEPAINYELYQSSILSGIVVWETELDKMSEMFNPPKGYSWVLNIKEFTYDYHKDMQISDFIECNIFIVFENNMREEDPNTLGKTYFDHANSRHKYAVITVYVYQENPTINIDPDPSTWKDNMEYIGVNTMRQIIAHEMGHALGLGHYYAGMAASRSVMEFSMSAWDESNYLPPQALDIYALIIKYGADGFKVWDYGVSDKWFIPPHNPNHVERLSP